jgi:hypothetical protein
MGIDYSANYGIGYEVCESDEISEDDCMEDGLNEYLENECGEEFECFEENQGYDTDVIATYLVLRFPLLTGLDLTDQKEKLDNEIKRLKLETEGDFGLVGGMYVY